MPSIKRLRRLRTIAVLPTLFTLGNLVCGFFSIVVAARVDAPESQNVPVSSRIVHREPGERTLQFDKEDPMHNIVLGVILIFAAMVFDALDGHIARLANSSSDFGAQLDSLADLVTFGVAPAFLLVKMCPTFTYDHRTAVWVIAATFAVCAALRLARFNVESDEEDDHSQFKGLPSPAAAVSVASFAIAFYMLRRERPGGPLEYADEIDSVLQTVLPMFALLAAFLMVSRIPYPHFMNQLVRGQRTFAHLIGLVFALTAITLVPGISLPVVCVAFVFSGPARYVWEEYVQKRPHREPVI